MFKHILKLIWNKRRNNLLLFSEIFFCFLVVFAALAFCLKSFRAYTAPIGYDTQPLWKIQQSATESLDSAALLETRRLFKSELLSIDGVEAVTFAGYALPFSGSMWSNGSDAMGFEYWTTMIGGDVDYAQTLGVELSEGRFFTESDYNAKYPPMLVNQKIADDFFGGASLIDSIIIMNDTEHKVVGMMDNIRYRDGFEEEMKTTIFLEPLHKEDDLHNLLIRVAPGSGAELEQAISKVAFEVLKTEDVKISSMQRDRDRIARSTWIPIVIFMVIAGFLVVNVAMGLFGVLFYTIAKRKGEIGVRRAMGATRGEVTRQFTLEIFLVTAAAMLLGIALSIQIPLLDLIPDEDFAHDNFYWAIILAFALISVIVLFCAYWPSRQGANLHPALALHEE